MNLNLRLFWFLDIENMRDDFLKIACFVASQENAKNIQKMTKFTKAPKVKKYPNKNM